MKHIKIFEEFSDTIEFVNKNNKSIKITVYKKNGVITEIDNPRNIRFPFSVGQRMSRNIESWACNNHFLMNGKDMCPEEKIFGIRKSDVPQGHILRTIYPNKFR